GTGIGDDAAASLASAARARDGEETLLVTNLSASSARAAGGGTFAGSRARTLTLCAGIVAADIYRLFGTKDRFFELQRHVGAEVATALRPAAAATAPAEHVA